MVTLSQPFFILSHRQEGMRPMKKPIDFKQVRADADFLTVLTHYNITAVKDGQKPGQYKCHCPFHDDRRPSLKINTERNVFHCFPCEASGNVLEFVMRYENLEALPAAKRLMEICNLGETAPATGKAERPSKEPTAPEPEAMEDGIPYNRGLTFELKLTQPPELLTWLKERGIDESMIDAFGLGLASNRSKTIGGRLAIPIHNEKGELIAYCGRSLDDAEPKYRLPTNFRKDLALFNLHRVSPSAPPATVILVESYLSVIKHHAEDWAIVSPMGRSISEAQIELLHEHGFTHVIVIADGDTPGREGARSIASALSPSLWVRVIDLPDGQKPHHLDQETFHQLCAGLGQEGTTAETS
jgi:DNA primase